MPGSPATTTRLLIPRYASSDPAEFPAQANAISDQIDLTVAGFDDGTLAARPAAAAANKGYLYYVTSGASVDTLFYSNGTTWLKVPIGFVTSDVLKPTYGIQRPSAQTNIAQAGTDVTGCTFNITPTVASVLRLEYFASIFFDVTPEACQVSIYSDGNLVSNSTSEAYLHSTITEGTVSVGTAVDIALSAAAHTIKMRCTSSNTNTPLVNVAGTCMKWELVAQ